MATVATALRSLPETERISKVLEIIEQASNVRAAGLGGGGAGSVAAFGVGMGAWGGTALGDATGAEAAARAAIASITKNSLFEAEYYKASKLNFIDRDIIWTSASKTNRLVVQQAMELLGEQSSLNESVLKTDLMDAFRARIAFCTKTINATMKEDNPQRQMLASLQQRFASVIDKLEDLQGLGTNKLAALGPRGLYHDRDTLTGEYVAGGPAAIAAAANIAIPLPIAGQLGVVEGFRAVQEMDWTALKSAEAELASLEQEINGEAKTGSFDDFGIRKKGLIEPIKLARREIEKRKARLNHIKSSLGANILNFKQKTYIKIATDATVRNTECTARAAAGTLGISANAAAPPGPAVELFKTCNRIWKEVDLVDPQWFEDNQIEKVVLKGILADLYTKGYSPKAQKGEVTDFLNRLCNRPPRAPRRDPVKIGALAIGGVTSAAVVTVPALATYLGTNVTTALAAGSLLTGLGTGVGVGATIYFGARALMKLDRLLDENDDE